MSDEVGLIDGDICGRGGCVGKMQEQPSDAGCSCHINPPCGHCVNMIYECDTCSEETELPTYEPAPKSAAVAKPWMRTKSPQEVFNELPADEFGYITIPGQYYWMEYKGKYPESMSADSIVANFNTCFGFKWLGFPKDGVFHIKVYTD